ncbi:MAG: hypothetical protein NZ108_02105 [Bacteroidia bacterium]|nr:hypothetical protein [Bacteroidia bacterium]
MKQYILLSVLLIGHFSMAQNVGIGTITPNATALLDLTSTTSGLLPPRMTAAQRTAITTPATGLLVYQTDGTSGFYYYNGSSWVLVSTASSGWNITGNAGTNPATDFIGSTDNVDFVTRTNNTERMRVTAGGNVGIGTTAPTQRLHVVGGSILTDRAYAASTFGVSAGATINIAQPATQVRITDDGAAAANAINYTATPIEGQYLWITNNDAQTATFTHTATPILSNRTMGFVYVGSACREINAFPPVTVTANNGLYVFGGNTVRLGGNLIENTNITNSGFSLNIAGSSSTTTFSATGNVGIGTTAPTNRLHVQGGDILVIDAAGTGGFIKSFDDNHGIHFREGGIDRNNYYSWGGTISGGQGHRFLTGGTKTSQTLRMQIANDGVFVNNIPVGIAINPSIYYQLYAYHYQLTANGDGQHGIYGYRTRDSQNDGTGYSYNTTNSASGSFNFWGDLYTFGTAGFCWNEYTRTGGVLGAQWSGSYWGSLGYRTSGSANVGVYGSTGYASGGGYLPTNHATGVGGAFAGDLMGGWARGEVLGFTTKGNLYASYNLGNEYTSGFQADLVSAGNEKVPAFAKTSTQLKIEEEGVAQLVNGMATVTLSDAFVKTMSPDQKPVISLTPYGSPVGLYVKQISKNSFIVATLDNSPANIEFAWTISAKRIDANQVKVPSEITDPKFDERLDGFMFNDGNTEDSGKPMWWNGKTLQFDQPPHQTVDEATKKRMEQEFLNRNKK